MLYTWLSVFPLMVEVVLQVVYLFIGTPAYSPVVNTIAWAWMLIGRQIYLLCINLYYVCKGRVSYIRSMVSMVGIIVLSVGLMLGFHKMQYGTFMGDVPGGVYCLLIIIPSIVVFAGVAICAIGVAIYKIVRKIIRKRHGHGDGSHDPN